MKKIKYFIAGIAMFGCATVFAQDEGTLTLKADYSIAFPMGSFKNIVNNNSYKGFGGELMYHTSNSFAIGIASGSQLFYEKFPRTVYKQSDGSDVSAVVSNTVQAVPILLKAQYNFLAQSAIRPYIAIGVGGNAITYSQYGGEYINDRRSAFRFAASPEAGIYIPFRKYSRAGISLGAAYSYMPFNVSGINNLNSFTARAGISFPLD